MKIAVVGAKGMVGSRVVNEAASRGHGLVAIFRKEPPTAMPPRVTAVEGDANDAARMSTLFNGVNAIVAATHPAPGHEHTLARTTTALLDAAATARKRILVVGGAAQLDACRTHPADWVCLSPPIILEPGQRTGEYRRATTTLITRADGDSRISAEDLAVAVVDELENPSGIKHFTVGY